MMYRLGEEHNINVYELHDYKYTLSYLFHFFTTQVKRWWFFGWTFRLLYIQRLEIQCTATPSSIFILS